jgi:hypothetical protein
VTLFDFASISFGFFDFDEHKPSFLVKRKKTTKNEEKRKQDKQHFIFHVIANCCCGFTSKHRQIEVAVEN